MPINALSPESKPCIPQEKTSELNTRFPVPPTEKYTQVDE